jgi:hypothetical protein
VLYKKSESFLISHSQRAGNVVINKQGSNVFWELDLAKEVWIAKEKF